MQWSDESIVLSARRHGETSALVRVLTREHGVFAGIAKGAQSKSSRGLYQPGNLVSAAWQARLAEHLGLFRCEMKQAVAAQVMDDALKLAALSSVCALIETALPERHPYPRLYEGFRAFLATLCHTENWLEDYIKLELSLLAESGFGLDLSHCAATGQTHDLCYVSPKSGRAVSREAGEPYKDRLLTLPKFLTPSPQGERKATEVVAGLRLSGYFLESWLLAPHGKKLPAARGRLTQTVKASHGQALEYEA